jgi:uncharacterized protein (TIGR00255 family)
MTGFASAKLDHGDWQVTTDIRSVNGRGLDLRLRVPDWIEGLEPEVRKILQTRLARGSVSLTMRVSRTEASGVGRVSAEGLEAALQVLKAIAAQAQEVGLDVAPASAGEIAAMRGVVEVRDEVTGDTDSLRAAILTSLGPLTEAFDQDRAREGAALSSVLRTQLEDVRRLVGEADICVGDRASLAKEALTRNLARLLEAGEMPDEARLVQELALLAVKSDVTEELDRLKTHVGAALKLLGDDGPVGRKLDFLMQEFNREANTLCSKAQSSALTAVGLDLKAVIDQMREQVQNVE